MEDGSFRYRLDFASGNEVPPWDWYEAPEEKEGEEKKRVQERVKEGFCGDSVPREAGVAEKKSIQHLQAV